MRFSDRVLLLRRRKGLTQDEFAKELGISRNYLSMIVGGREPSEALVKLISLLEKHLDEGKGTPAAEDADRLREESPSPPTHGRGLLKAARVAAALDLDAADLLAGSDHPPARGPNHGTVGATPPIYLPPGHKARYVPLLSMAQCGAMMAYDDTAYDHSGFLAVNPLDRCAFAVTLAGDSMLPQMAPGDVALIYPSQPPRNGDVVLVRLDDDHGGDVMVKLFQSSGEKVVLSSFNPAYPPMEFHRAHFRFVYPVASITRTLRH